MANAIIHLTMAEHFRRIWRWCRRRGGSKWVVLILLMLLLRLGWGWWVHRQVQGKLARLHEEGHPIALSELPITPVAEEENAWAWQERAAKIINDKVDSPRSSTLQYANYPPYSAEWMKLAEESEKAYGKAFRLARRAREFSKVQTRKRLEAWSSTDTLQITNAKGLANIIADGAEYKHLKG